MESRRAEPYSRGSIDASASFGAASAPKTATTLEGNFGGGCRGSAGRVGVDGRPEKKEIRATNVLEALAQEAIAGRNLCGDGGLLTTYANDVAAILTLHTRLLAPKTKQEKKQAGA
ncbi:hypothetical protein KM043_012750 [Ampulex compressa]|nr:hypothetical protein KM043_012750 [Ampulex compressa]